MQRQTNLLGTSNIVAVINTDQTFNVLRSRDKELLHKHGSFCHIFLVRNILISIIAFVNVK